MDDEDFERIDAHKWCAMWHPGSRGFYAVRAITVAPGKTRLLYMHREVMRAQPNQLVDHKYHRTLDNRKSELRFCTGSQSTQNRRIGTNSRSGFKGVSKKGSRWEAYIRLDRKKRHLGYFDDPKLAAKAYDEAAVALFGEFAVTNENQRKQA